MGQLKCGSRQRGTVQNAGLSYDNAGLDKNGRVLLATS